MKSACQPNGLGCDVRAFPAMQATGAMLSMTRIDIAALQKAYAGKSGTSAAGRITGPASGHGLGRERRMGERERETSAAPADAGAFSARAGWRRPEVVEYEIGYLVAELPASREVDHGVLPGGTTRGFPVQHTGNCGTVSRQPIRPAVARMVMARRRRPCYPGADGCPSARD